MKTLMLPLLYEAISQNSLYAIVAFDLSNEECLFINPAAEELLGAKDLKPTSLIPIIDKNNFRPFSVEILENEGLYHDIVVANQHGGRFIGNIGVRHLTLQEQSVCLVMLQDVTIQKRLQRDILAKQTEIKAAFEELLKQNRQLKELDIAKDRFIALTTHELRTPLSGMVASAEILKLGLYDTKEEMIEFINMIYDQGIHLQELVNDILDFAKIQAGKMDFYIEMQDPVPLCEAIMSNFTGMAESNQVQLIIESPSEDVACYFDELRLRQIVSNIVNNAIKYNRQNGTVTLCFNKTEAGVRINVTDTGRGIPEEQSGKVFNEFETIGQVAQHHKGTGLGMPISRKLAEGMGGQLNFESTVDVGSTFWVEIPTSKVLDEEIYRPRPEKNGGNLAA